MEYLDVLVPYVIGTIAGVWLCYRYIYAAIQERLIVTTIDRLVDEGYCRAYTNEEGEVELYKWYELDDIMEAIAKENIDEENDAP
jgi:hypothetical protein